MSYLAHSRSSSGREDYLSEHLRDVAERAGEYAGIFGADQEAIVAGLFHDLGKYSELFQERLKGHVRGVDHWTVGAWVLLQKYRLQGIAAALAVQGHHLGLRQGTKDALQQLNPAKGIAGSTIGMHLCEMESLITSFTNDGLMCPDKLEDSVYQWKSERNASDMLDVRMLFSALVDADFIETEAHFAAKDSRKKWYRPKGPELNPERALSVLLEHVAGLTATSTASEEIKRVRSDLMVACLAAAENDPGIFTLTAPTGSGKTLAMLAFALKHALLHNLRRIIVVIPYLTIIDQTVNSYREALSSLGDKRFLERYVLEDHSLAGTRGGVEKTEDVERLLAENWDAPIIVTTSVQFYESLFANRPSACRKLHRVAHSVILFDEVQTFPVKLIVPTLATLSRLNERYGASVVFSTATQPAFQHLHKHVLAHSNKGWQPREIVPKELKLSKRATRTRVVWPGNDDKLSFEDLVSTVTNQEQVLVILNLRRHAADLAERLKSLDGVFHLSTNMCPAHREVVLEEVRKRLASGKEPCRLVATQCVEAGVDLDFPVVYRALGPLESIAQAAGRCNRHGRRSKGLVHIFRLDSTEGKPYPDRAYEQATMVAELLLKRLGDSMDISDEHVFEEYYRLLYNVARPENQYPELTDAITLQDFERVAQLYRIIPQEAINILVPYDYEVYQELAEEVRETGLTRDWIQRARPYSVSEFRPTRDAPVLNWIEAVPVGHKGATAHDWFIYLVAEHYDQLKGLQPLDSPGFFQT